MIIEKWYNTIISCDKVINLFSSTDFTVTIILKDYNGNPIIGEKVTADISGISRSGETNENGVCNLIWQQITITSFDYGIHVITCNDAKSFCKLTYDTGWQNVSVATGYYGTVKYRQRNDTVEISGTFRNSAAVTPSNNVLLGSIPAKHAPKESVGAVMQGSGANIFHIEAKPSGDLVWKRYGTTSTGQCPANAYLQFQVRYMI